MISLTVEERIKFAAWLKQEAETDSSLLKEMKNFPGLEALIKQRTAEVTAKLFVVRLLQYQEIQGEDVHSTI